MEEKYRVLQMVSAPAGTRAVLRGERGAVSFVPVLAFALCEVEDGKETWQQICGVFAGEGLDICEDLLAGQLCFYLAPGEKLTPTLKRIHKLK